LAFGSFHSNVPVPDAMIHFAPEDNNILEMLIKHFDSAIGRTVINNDNFEFDIFSMPVNCLKAVLQVTLCVPGKYYYRKFQFAVFAAD
jgi:hypothetical protein